MIAQGLGSLGAASTAFIKQPAIFPLPARSPAINVPPAVTMSQFPRMFSRFDQHLCRPKGLRRRSNASSGKSDFTPIRQGIDDQKI
jgi:hypothetical protein